MDKIFSFFIIMLFSCEPKESKKERINQDTREQFKIEKDAKEVPSSEKKEISDDERIKQVLTAWIKNTEYDIEKIDKTHHLDLDQDGIKEAFVEYVVSYPSGGNWFGFNVAILKKSLDGEYNVAYTGNIRGKNQRSIKFKHLKSDSILVFDVLKYGEEDGSCCPSIPSKTYYQYVYGELKELNLSE